jgi:hypothetical protein
VETPRDLHLADVLVVDLRELAVTLVGHVARLHRPVLQVRDELFRSAL